ncbi:hypothetical protein [Tessaracoccus sp.]
MASWTDGAAYAPIERPDGFATPEVAALEVALPEAARTPGPLPTPTGFAPTAPVIPLDQVQTATSPQRNPSAPFLVSGGLLTAASSMGHDGPRDPRTPFKQAPDPTGPQDLPPPTGAPLAPPMGMPMATAPFGQAPGASQQQSTQRTLVFLAVASMVLGLTIPAVAPWMLVVAGSLTLRTVRITGKVGPWVLGTGLLLLIFSAVIAPDVLDSISRLVCLGFGATFATAAVKTYSPRR